MADKATDGDGSALESRTLPSSLEGIGLEPEAVVTAPQDENDRRTDDHDDVERLASLECELQLVQKLRRTFAACLHLMEAARDDLITLGERMDRLTTASRQCREALAARRQEANITSGKTT